MEKTYKLYIKVDVNKLIEAYTGGMEEIDRDSLPPVYAMVEHELGWLGASGISLIGEVYEVPEE